MLSPGVNPGLTTPLETDDIGKIFSKPVSCDLQAEGEQIDREFSILENLRYENICPSEITYNIQKLPDIQHLNDKMYDSYKIMNNTECMLHAMTRNPVKFSEEYVRNVKQIGEKSVHGIVFKADVDGAEGMFVAKISKKSRDDLIHEIFIGVMALNEMRTVIPNFMYTYGYVECASPRGVAEFCPGEGNTLYLLLENLKNTTSLREYLKTNPFNLEEFINIYLQVLLSLQMAYEYYDFTHFDLHDMNVLLRDPPAGKNVIHYTIRGEDIFLKVNKVATIIDFGTSHISIDGRNYGNYRLCNYDVLNHSFPLYDSYKLFMFAMDSARNNSINDLEIIGTEMNPIFNYFYDDRYNLWLTVEDQIETYYAMPAEGNLPFYDHTELINRILKNYDVDYSKERFGNVMG